MEFWNVCILDIGVATCAISFLSLIFGMRHYRMMWVGLLFLDSHCAVFCKNMSASVQERCKKIHKYFREHGCKPEMFQLSCYYERSIYGTLCQYLSRKNSFKNRILMYMVIKRKNLVSFTHHVSSRGIISDATAVVLNFFIHLHTKLYYSIFFW